MTKRKPQTFLSALSNPRIGPLRRCALQLLQLAHEMERGTFPEVRNDKMERLPSLDCVSCDVELNEAAHSALYCSVHCQYLAGTVRYVRKKIAEGQVYRVDVQEGIGMRLIQGAGGGYPAKERKLSSKQRSAIFARDNHTCKLCGGKATDIDHIKGDSSDPSNLRALCGDCNTNAAVENIRAISPDTDPEEFQRIEEMYEHMAQRIAAPQPLRFCDDYVHWNKTQGAIRGARGKLMREARDEAESDFEDVDDYLFNAMQKDD